MLCFWRPFASSPNHFGTWGRNFGTDAWGIPILSEVGKRVVFQKGGFPKGWFWRMFPPERKPERGYIRMFPRNENRNEGTFALFPQNENWNEGTLDGGNKCFSNRALILKLNLVETNFGASKALYLKAFQSLKNCLD